MADITKDIFDLTKQRQKVLYQRGRDVADFELNEAQDIQRVQRRKTFESLFGSGFVGIGFQIIPVVSSNEINIGAGVGLIQGEYVENFSTIVISGLTTPSGSDRTDIVYLEVREVERDSIQDPDILAGGIGETARRIRIEFEVKVDEGSIILPPTTGELHDGGIHRELLGFINRLDGVATIDLAQLSDSRTILGQAFRDEDKSLELIGGGEVKYTESTGRVDLDETSLGGGVGGVGNIIIAQPSTAGNAIIDVDDSNNNPFFLANSEDLAYVVLDRDAASDYNVTIQTATASTLPNSPNTFLIAIRNIDDKLYFNDGSCWSDGQQHLIRIAPFTGQIQDADVAANADIQGTKLLDGSMPFDKIDDSSPIDPVGVDNSGLYKWNTTSISTNTTIIDTDDNFTMLVDNSGGPVEVTLPNPALGQRVVKVKITSDAQNDVTIKRNSTELIDGVASDKVFNTPFGCITFITDLTDWFVIDDYIGDDRLSHAMSIRTATLGSIGANTTVQFNFTNIFERMGTYISGSTSADTLNFSRKGVYAIDFRNIWISVGADVFVSFRIEKSPGGLVQNDAIGVENANDSPVSHFLLVDIDDLASDYILTFRTGGAGQNSGGNTHRIIITYLGQTFPTNFVS